MQMLEGASDIRRALKEKKKKKERRNLLLCGSLTWTNAK